MAPSRSMRRQGAQEPGKAAGVALAAAGAKKGAIPWLIRLRGRARLMEALQGFITVREGAADPSPPRGAQNRDGCSKEWRSSKRPPAPPKSTRSATSSPGRCRTGIRMCAPTLWRGGSDLVELTWGPSAESTDVISWTKKANFRHGPDMPGTRFRRGKTDEQSAFMPISHALAASIRFNGSLYLVADPNGQPYRKFEDGPRLRGHMDTLRKHARGAGSRTGCPIAFATPPRHTRLHAASGSMTFRT